MDRIIIGAGFAGLAAGLKTGYPIFEMDVSPGGICRSYRKDGFHFDFGGGHWIFGDPRIKEYIQKFVDLKEYPRRAGVHICQIFEYPIQKYFEGAEPVANPGSLKEWMSKKFSPEACRLFFHPFNEKYTAGLYDLIIQDDEKKSPSIWQLGYNDVFSYPTVGLDDLCNKMAKRLDISYQKELVKISPVNRLAHFSDGSTLPFNRMISTAPLDKMIRLCGWECTDLPYTSVIVLNIGAKAGKRLPKHHWLYIPDRNIPFFRVGFYSNVDPRLAPEGCVSIYVERAVKSSADVDPGYDQLVVSWLQDQGWIQEVLTKDHNFIETAYTWCYRNTSREKHLARLKEAGIDMIGRYGKWKFQGIAESIKDGLSL